MIHGAHAIIYSKDAEADRTFFRDVLKYRFADAGHGWLIFALPPAEIAIHPSDDNDVHQVYLMCDDVEAFKAAMQAKGVTTSPVLEERWGRITLVALPGGGKLGVYQPKHPSPLGVRSAKKRATAKPKKSSAKKGAAKKSAAKKSSAKTRTTKKRARTR